MSTDQPTPEIIKRKNGTILIHRGAQGKFAPPALPSAPARRKISAQEFANCATDEDIRDRFESLIRQAQKDGVTLEFNELRLSGTDLVGLNLAGCVFQGCDFQNAILHHAILAEASFDGGVCSSEPIAGIDCHHNTPRANDFGKTRAKHAQLQHAVLRRSWLHQADLKFANLTATDLREACLTGADFFGATLSNDTLIDPEMLLYVNTSRGDFHAEQQDFGHANLTRARIVQAKILSCNLSGAKMRAAYFSRVSLCGSILDGADLSEATFDPARPSDLRRVRFRSAILVGACMETADLVHADLTNANLSGARLGQANLLCANLTGADLSGADLSEAKVSLEQIESVANRVDAKLPPAIERKLRERASEGVIRAISKSRAR